MGCSPSSPAPVNKDSDSPSKASTSYPTSAYGVNTKYTMDTLQASKCDKIPNFDNIIEALGKKAFQVGLVNFKEDSLFNAIKESIHKTDWKESSVDVANLDGGSYDIIIIDCRQHKILQPDVISAIKSAKDLNQSLVVVTIVKKNFFDKCDLLHKTMIEAGVDQIELDVGTYSVNFWQYKLESLKNMLILPKWKETATKMLITTLDHCKSLVLIMDTQNRIQFVNRTFEKTLGYKNDEIVGLNFLDIQNRDDQTNEVEGSLQQPHLPLNHSSSGGAGGYAPLPAKNISPTNTMTHSSTTPPQPVSSSYQYQLAQQLPLHEKILEDLMSEKTWEGAYVYNPKTGDPVSLNTRAFTYHVAPQHNQKFFGPLFSNFAKDPFSLNVWISEPPSLYVEKSFSSDNASNQEGPYALPRGSLKSLRKASYDIKAISNDSSILRRQSLAKLHSLTFEAPITKVINIIAAAQQNCPNYVSQALDKVLEILRTTELYSPPFFEGTKTRPDDPLTTDLLGALLSQGPRPSALLGRRSSSEASARMAPRPSLPDIAEAPTKLQKLLETEANWGFDIMLLEEITDKRPLVWLGMAIFARFGVGQTLGVDDSTLRNWLTLIEANYHATNTYHNSTHSADVLQATAFFLSCDRLKIFFEPLDEVVSLLAAIVHDVDHPGKNSAFLINCGNELALLYNDLTVLESHHAAFAFKLTLSDPRVNILKNLDPETYKSLRHSLVDMVLATEMSKHFEHLAKFVNVFTKPCYEKEGGSDNSPAATPEPDITTLVTPDNIVLIKRMLVKCADVSNPTRPVNLAIEWAKRMAEEYFRQTEEEISRGIPPVMPMFERNTCSIPKSQTGFIDYFIDDMYEAWDTFLDIPEVIDHMKFNHDFWKELDRSGVRSAQQIDQILESQKSSSNKTSVIISQL